MLLNIVYDGDTQETRISKAKIFGSVADLVPGEILPVTTTFASIASQQPSDSL